LAWLPGTLRYADEWIFPGGMSDNRAHYSQWVSFADGIPEEKQALLFNPETSGGLLIAVPEDHADALLVDLAAAGDVPQRIGRVLPGEGRIRVRA
jgi:selenide,water dikinase